MATQKKTTKAQAQGKVKDLKPKKDVKGGLNPQPLPPVAKGIS
jgi:hypothetical protein